MNTIGLAGVVISGIIILLAVVFTLLYGKIPAHEGGAFLGLCAGIVLFAEYAMLAGWWPDAPFIAIIPMAVFLAAGLLIGGFFGLWIESRKARP